jgi:hypothetical protein
MAAIYVPRSPTTSVLYGVVRGHLPALVAAVDAETEGSGLPGFVVNEFRKFLRCGVLTDGFARVRCGDCPRGAGWRWDERPYAHTHAVFSHTPREIVMN